MANVDHMPRNCISLALACGVSMVLLARSARADVTPRISVTQHGDFVLMGNTLAQDCASAVVPPVVGTVGACGNNTSDTAPDVFWQANDPGSAVANTSIGVTDARSTAVLQLPAGASVTFARLFWSAATTRNATTGDLTVLVERVGSDAFSRPVVGDGTVVVTPPGQDLSFYQSSADVTALVQQHGPGPYRVGGVDTISLLNLDEQTTYAAWSMVVFYTLPSAPLRRLVLFDGLASITPGGADETATLSGFLIPPAPFDAKVGVVTYEGDNSLVGDSLLVDGTPLSDALNPANNFFNGTRSFLGAPVSVAGDLPQTTGGPGSLSSADIDVVDGSAVLSPGQSSAELTITTTGDFYNVGVLVASVTTFSPELTAVKAVSNVSRPGSSTYVAGDTIEYTITVTNTGTDGSINTTLADPIPPGLTYLPGSLRITAGPNAGALTDPADTDQGEFDGIDNAVSVRLGTGANGITGGSLAIGESTTVAFRATINLDFTGLIPNSALISGGGESGGGTNEFPSDGDPNVPGPQPVVIIVPGRISPPPPPDDGGLSGSDSGTPGNDSGAQGNDAGTADGATDAPGARLSASASSGGGGCGCAVASHSGSEELAGIGLLALAGIGAAARSGRRRRPANRRPGQVISR
jgi:uncharacterized repeat protein (TIGR01451 family)/MYXO-CTERM domain-containing protein